MVGRRWLGAVGLAACLVTTPASTASAGEATPKIRHHDPNWKFSILMFEEWKVIPIPPAGPDAEAIDRRLVARFFEPGDGDGRYCLPDGNRGIAEVYRIGPFETGSIEELLILAAKRRGIPLPMEGGKAIKTKDGVPGTTWPMPYTLDFHWHTACATWRKDGAQLGVWIAAHYVSAGSRMGLERVVNSVMWSDERMAAPSFPELAGLNISPERKKAIERGLVKGWKVLVSRAKQYVLVYNAKGGKNNRLAQLIAERIEAIRKQQYEVIFPPGKPIDATSVVRICGDGDEYHAYGGPSGSDGYWNSRDEELVLYDADPDRAPDDDTLAVLYHEAFHQYVYYAAGQVAPASWFNEGHGDYFAGAQFKEGKFRIEPFLWRVSTIKAAISAGSRGDRVDDPQVREKGPEEGYFPLERLVHMSQRDYYLRPGVAYAEGWSLVYFLRAIVPTKPEWAAKWGKILETYFRVLREESAKPEPPPASGGATRPKPTPEGPEEPAPDPSEPPKPAPPAGGTGPDDPGIPVVLDSRRENASALKKALDAAFDGVDLAELESAWASSIVKIETPRRR